MSRRQGRWWRPATTRRPAQRARARRTYSEQEMGEVFDTGYTVGQGDERKRSRERDEWLRRVAEACDEGPDAVTALARECGVMPAEELSDPGQLVDEVERWLRDQK